MNIRKFLKPDWRKIVVTLIFLILHFLFSSFSEYSFCASNFAGFTCGYFALLGILSLPIDFLIWFTMDWWAGYWGYYYPIFLILTVFYYYLLSCLIVWIYDKVKKK
jgi:hypothetical protein